MEELRRRIDSRVAAVGVVGLGYVGLPLAVEFAKAGFPVVGLDIDAERVRRIGRGENYIGDVQDEELRALVASGRLGATTGWDAVPTLDVLILCVPTPFNRNKEPDLSSVRSAAEEIAARLRHGHLVILESTTYPGTTEEVLLPLLESGGLRVGRDFALVYSPERVDPGNRTYQIPNTPKVVGGVTARCTAVAVALYESIVVKVVQVSSPRVAEMSKLLENIFRNVNIALVNELAMLADRMGIDIWEVIEASATKPFGFMSFQPGPGVGGHCLPVDPVYLAWKAKEYDFYTNFITLAAEVNANMPYFVAQKVTRALARQGIPIRDARVLILGVAFKRDVADVRNSSALKLIQLLTEEGLTLSYFDPFVPEIEVNGNRYRSVPLTAETLGAHHCVVIHTDHSAFDYELILRHAPLVVDTRNALRNFNTHREKIMKL